MSTRTGQINIVRTQEFIVRDVLFDDNRIETFRLSPGVFVSDILRERGDTREYIEFPGGTTHVRF